MLSAVYLKLRNPVLKRSPTEASNIESVKLSFGERLGCREWDFDGRNLTARRSPSFGRADVASGPKGGGEHVIIATSSCGLEQLWVRQPALYGQAWAKINCAGCEVQSELIQHEISCSLVQVFELHIWLNLRIACAEFPEDSNPPWGHSAPPVDLLEQPKLTCDTTRVQHER